MLNLYYVIYLNQNTIIIYKDLLRNQIKYIRSFFNNFTYLSSLGEIDALW